MDFVNHWIAGRGVAAAGGAVLAGSYADTVCLFKNAGKSAGYFNDSYGYAIFPTIGKGGS